MPLGAGNVIGAPELVVLERYEEMAPGIVRPKVADDATPWRLITTVSMEVPGVMVMRVKDCATSEIRPKPGALNQYPVSPS